MILKTYYNALRSTEFTGKPIRAMEEFGEDCKRIFTNAIDSIKQDFSNKEISGKRKFKEISIMILASTGLEIAEGLATVFLSLITLIELLIPIFFIERAVRKMSGPQYEKID